MIVKNPRSIDLEDGFYDAVRAPASSCCCGLEYTPAPDHSDPAPPPRIRPRCCSQYLSSHSESTCPPSFLLHRPTASQGHAPPTDMSAKASGSDAQANGDARNRQHHDGSKGRAYTVEQKAAVIRIKQCSPTAYYEILGLESVKTTCSEGEIKKAYRKLSLLTHPDKNGYDGADEAFKRTSIPATSSSHQMLTMLQLYRKPSRSCLIPRRRKNTIGMEATPILVTQAAHRPADRASATSPARAGDDQDPCSKKRYRQRRCSDSSLAAEEPLGDPLVCLLDIADSRSF